MPDEQDQAENLDGDKIDDDVRVEEDPAVYPPDSYQGVDEYGLTAAEERYDEPFEEQVLREEPEPLVEELEGRAPAPRPRHGRVDDPDISAEEAAMHIERDR